MREVFVQSWQNVYENVQALYSKNQYIGIENCGEKYFMTCVKGLNYIAVRPKGWNQIHPDVDRFFVFDTKQELLGWMSKE